MSANFYFERSLLYTMVKPSNFWRRLLVVLLRPVTLLRPLAPMVFSSHERQSQGRELVWEARGVQRMCSLPNLQPRVPRPWRMPNPHSLAMARDRMISERCSAVVAKLNILKYLFHHFNFHHWLLICFGVKDLEIGWHVWPRWLVQGSGSQAVLMAHIIKHHVETCMFWCV